MNIQVKPIRVASFISASTTRRKVGATAEYPATLFIPPKM